MKQKGVNVFKEKRSGFDEAAGKVVVVAVRASKEISKAGLVWALTHVVQPGDCIKLLVVIPSYTLSNLLLPLSCITFHGEKYELYFIDVEKVLQIIIKFGSWSLPTNF